MHSSSLYAQLLKSIISISVLSWLAVVLLTRAETSHEIEELFDAQLAQEAGIIFEVSKKAIQQDILLSSILQKTTYGHKYEYKISFQIWQDQRLLFRTHNTPLDKFTHSSGYGDQLYENKKWRVFATQETQNDIKYTIITAAEYDIRDELIGDVVFQATTPLLLALPILVLLMHFAIKKGLRPLKTIANTVAEKNTMDFAPVQIEAIPKEIQAVIAALNKLMQRLKIAFDKERRFTMNAAHELRTPIAALQVQAQVAKGSLGNKTQLITAIDNILKGTKKSTHLITQMLTLARLEPEAIKERFLFENIAHIIRDSVSEHVPVALEKEIEITFDSPPDKECEIFHDTQGIGIMMNNLIQNAIRYTPKHGEITIQLKCDEQLCKIIITDSGPGISESEIDKVMERYYRSTSQDKQGCGLGLSIVKQIVEIHGGSIKLSNNKGLVVAISIPKHSQ